MEDSQSLDPGEASLVWQCGIVKQLGLTSTSVPMSTADGARVTNYLNMMGKDKISKLFLVAWKHLSVAQNQIKSLTRSEREISGKLVESQKETIRLQGELIARKDEELQQVRSVVELSVKDTVQEGIKLYSKAVECSAPIKSDISSATIEKAIRNVAEEDSRSSNVVIFGLGEKQSEDLTAAVGQVFSELSEKPKFQASRIGTQKDDVTRPVIVELRTGDIAKQLLKKVSALRKSERFKDVYVCPDRTIEQRAQHRKLLSDLKTKIQEEPERTHYIRNGEIMSKDRDNGGGV